ncbi:junctional adhesion molecule 2b isoform X1 [Paramisgurnus dabryanus]|uniref:junctional adhesion molecule 2b isoform X1 n=1 Tax=Paramisgurnus dabryanus TaxID=90735 RepID=UPI0031F34E91
MYVELSEIIRTIWQDMFLCRYILVHVIDCRYFRSEHLRCARAVLRQDRADAHPSSRTLEKFISLHELLVQTDSLRMTLTRRLTLPALLMLINFLISACVTVTTRKPKVEVHENTNAVLFCEFRTERETNPRVEWKKRGRDVSYVYFDGEFTDSFKGRASIEGATVTLRGVTQNDSGVYQCEVSARHDEIKLGEVIVTLSVVVPPHAPSCDVPETVMRGSSAELRCKDKLSVPDTTYSWYKDNKPLSTAHLPEINYSLDPKTGTLKFKSVSKSDEGQYRCEASSGMGASKSCAGQLMKITEFELNLTLVIAVGLGVFFLLLSCSLAICLCCRHECCYSCHRKSTGGTKQKWLCLFRAKPYDNHPTDPKYYRHTQSFVL